MQPQAWLDQNLWDRCQLKTRARSLFLGRRLYTFNCEGQGYWLKMQLLQAHAQAIWGFEHEVQFYRELNPAHLFALPVQCVPSPCITTEMMCDTAIVLPQADTFFDQSINSLSIDEIQRHIKTALTTLASLHCAGFIHGDLKKEHFVIYQQQVYLIDFEQSVALGTHQIHNQVTATPHYMAPELFQGHAKTVQTDLYALGIIIYEWLTQQRLGAGTYHAWASLHCQQLTIELNDRYQKFLPFLKILLAKHYLARFKTAKHALEQLDQI